MKPLHIFLLGLLPFGSAALGQSRLYVDGDATGAGTGLSWTDAYAGQTGLQSALTYAGSHPSVVEIWVAAGTYCPAGGKGGSRSATFTLLNGVAIYGGFEGTETMLGQRVPSVFVTTLSGDLDNDDGPGPFQNNGENSLHVVNADSTNTTAVLDGFTITGGNANIGAAADSQGAGLTMINGEPTIRDCNVSYNNAAGRGAGVYILNNLGTHSPRFRFCVFAGNLAGANAGLGGGAIWSGTTFGTLTTSLIRCSVILNSATGHGGGIVVSRPAGGFGSCHFNMVGCYIYGNSTVGDGGALYIDTPSSNNTTLTNCEFGSNNANSAGGDGGAIYHLSGNLVVTNCTITNCIANTNGGGINTSLGNFLVVRNSILWGNGDSGGPDESGQLHITGGVPNVSYSIVQGGWSGSGTNNLSSDPMFFNPTNYDNRVFANSPAVDSGNNLFVPTDTLDVDEDGNTNEPTPLALGGIGRFSDNPYVADTGGGVAPIVDRGAWEVRQFVYLYVDGDGLPGIGEWATAYTSLQDALDEAQASAAAEIWVADGTYQPTPCCGNQDASFEMRNHVAIYGGFAGFETMLSERDPDVNVSILSGDLLGDDGPNFANRGENVRHVVTADSTDSTAVLDGFTIRGGRAKTVNLFGGGLTVMNTTGTTISNCIITDNEAIYGGGAYLSTGTPGTFASFVDCVFEGNCGFNNGGGLYITGSNVSGTIIDCTFRNNESGNGGGIGDINGQEIIQNCTFDSNTAGSGGGFWGSNNTAKFRYCTFSSNSASIGGGVSFDNGNQSLVNCTFLNNSATSGSASGGGLSIGGGQSTLYGCLFAGNMAHDGGGIRSAAGVTAVNCVFSGNSATTLLGGAVSHDTGAANIYTCTMANNTANVGGGFGMNSGVAAIRNSVFWNNSDVGHGMGEQGQVFFGGGTIDVDYSLIQGLTSFYMGMLFVGNIGLNPMFVDDNGADNVAGTIDDDLRLRAGSPAIDAGNSNLVGTDQADLDGDEITSGEKEPFDAAGHARFYDDPATANTGLTAPPLYPVVVDMGAYEFGGEDCNQNGIPDNCDISCGVANGPCDVPGCGMSTDTDMNGFPDECADFISGCGLPTPNWTCFDNWNLPGNIFPDNMRPATYDVTLDNVDTVFLDVDVTIDSLRVLDDAVLNVTQSGSAGDLTIATDDGLLIDGTPAGFAQLQVANNRQIDFTCGPATVISGYYGPDPAAPPGSVSSVLNCETLRIQQPSGQVVIKDTMAIHASVDIIVDGHGATPCTNDGGKTTPIKNISGFGLVDIGHDFILQGNTHFTNTSVENVQIGGDFYNTGTNANCFDCSMGGISLDGAAMQNYEVCGADMGASLAGFNPPAGHTNFSLGDLEVTSGAGHAVTFRNTVTNAVGTGACSEALYVHNLTLRNGSTITLVDVKVYYLNLVNEGATINTIGCGQLLPVQVACTMNSQCNDQAVCTYDHCQMGFCQFTEVEYGNVNGSPTPVNPNLDDILCVLAGFANVANCPNGDVRGLGDNPCVPNNTINLDDILAVLGAFSGIDLCGCTP